MAPPRRLPWPPGSATFPDICRHPHRWLPSPMASSSCSESSDGKESLQCLLDATCRAGLGDRGRELEPWLPGDGRFSAHDVPKSNPEPVSLLALLALFCLARGLLASPEIREREWHRGPLTSGSKKEKTSPSNAQRDVPETRAASLWFGFGLSPGLENVRVRRRPDRTVFESTWRCSPMT